MVYFFNLSHKPKHCKIRTWRLYLGKIQFIIFVTNRLIRLPTIKVTDELTITIYRLSRGPPPLPRLIHIPPPPYPQNVDNLPFFFTPSWVPTNVFPLRWCQSLSLMQATRVDRPCQSADHNWQARPEPASFLLGRSTSRIFNTWIANFS